MNVAQIREALLGCVILNIGLVTVWSILVLVAKGWLSRNGWIASSGPALLLSFSEGMSIASSKRVFGELGWFRQSCGIFRGISA
jgi:hypothetical protein